MRMYTYTQNGDQYDLPFSEALPEQRSICLCYRDIYWYGPPVFLSGLCSSHGPVDVSDSVSSSEMLYPQFFHIYNTDRVYVLCECSSFVLFTLQTKADVCRLGFKILI